MENPVEKLRNLGDGFLAKAAIVGVGALGVATSQLELTAIYPDSVAAERDAPARTAEPFAIGSMVVSETAENYSYNDSGPAHASYTPTRPCVSTDSKSSTPQWRMTSAFKTPNGKSNINALKPGALTRFDARIVGGNVEAFNLFAYYDGDKSIEILKKGSHPAWTPSGGRPHWAIKELCHWRDKRHISFLVKLDGQAKRGSKACFDTNTLASTADEKSIPGTLTPHCIEVK